ncbi:MAG: GNAT family N-acetyltransferase [Eubacteriales bacterium]
MINIRKANEEDMMQISQIRPEVYKKMMEMGLEQWDDNYPTDGILLEDIKKGEMLVALIEDEIAGYVTVNEEQPAEYDDIEFQFSPKLCVHRLSVNPKYARRGVAMNIMEYIHSHYKEQNYKSICLDTSDANKAALGLYSKLGYTIRGYVNFKRKPQYRFPVMEIRL